MMHLMTEPTNQYDRPGAVFAVHGNFRTVIRTIGAVEGSVRRNLLVSVAVFWNMASLRAFGAE
jgi:hypothetical protein